jgi:peptidylprolyl isomerase
MVWPTVGNYRIDRHRCSTGFRYRPGAPYIQLMSRLVLLVALSAAVSTGCRRQEAPLPAPIPPVAAPWQTAFTLRHIDLVQGTGAPVEARKCIYAHYTGWLTDGTKFDSSRDTTAEGRPREPIAFPQGARRVITGWDLGFDGMRVGGQRRLLIPYQLAYGRAGRPPVIPPSATLVFDVELMALADTLPRAEPGPPGTPPGCPRWAEVGGGS